MLRVWGLEEVALPSIVEPRLFLSPDNISDILVLENLNIASEQDSDWVESGDNTPYQAGNSSVITHTGQRITRNSYRNPSLHA